MKTDKKSILIIDQEPEWGGFFSDALKANDLIVHSASRIEDAISFLSTESGSKPDLILVDATFVEKDENGITSLIRIAKDQKKPVIILFATEPTNQKLRNSFQLGVSDCVRRPVNEDSLLMIVNQALARSRLEMIKLTEPVRPSSVLIVDDDDDWLTTMVSNLPPMEHVEIATNYMAAVEKINKHEFSLVISDLRLNDSDDRDMRGVDLIKNIRKQDKECSKFTPIIVVSAYGTPALIRDSYKKYQISYFFDKKYLSLMKYKESVLGALTVTASTGPKDTE